ncbi:MAG: hypothetical protein KDE51_26765, partial [Anaerolineales bacterium]|nr:hypothetical protein [Anaerolineales bacterium]
SPPGLLPVNSYLPYHRNPDFTGRETFLLQMAQTLLPQPDEAPQVKVAAVSGMGGLGKTQLAVEFAYRYGRYFSGGVYWVGMANEKHVAEEISRLGGERGMKLYRAADNLVLADRVGRVQQAWQAAVPRLLIFDNCEEESVLRRWLPVTGHCAILITCRRPRWPRGFDVTVLPLEVLSETESGRFLQRLVPRLSEAERLAVSHEVGQLPLALQLAGSFLNRYEQLGGEAYIQQLQQMDVVDHPSLQGWGSSYSPTGHERHIGEMFALSVNKLETAEAADQIAKQLLVIMTCFAPGEPVSTELLQQIMVPDQTDWQATILFTDGLNRLITLGLVRRESELTVAMHRLVVACVMGMIDDVQKEEAQTAVRETLMERLNPFSLPK